MRRIKLTAQQVAPNHVVVSPTQELNPVELDLVSGPIVGELHQQHLGSRDLFQHEGPSANGLLRLEVQELLGDGFIRILARRDTQVHPVGPLPVDVVRPEDHVRGDQRLGKWGGGLPTEDHGVVIRGLDAVQVLPNCPAFQIPKLKGALGGGAAEPRGGYGG